MCYKERKEGGKKSGTSTVQVLPLSLDPCCHNANKIKSLPLEPLEESLKVASLLPLALSMQK